MKRTITILMTICMLLTSITFGQLSAGAKVTVPKSKIKSVSIVDTTTLKIKWKKVKSVNGYELYCKKTGGKFKKIATLGKNKASYTHKKLTTNKKYIYKVRAYKTINGKKYFSKFSAQVPKKTTNYLMSISKPYSTVSDSLYYGRAYIEYEAYPNTFSMGGIQYSNGFTLGYKCSASFNLKGKYRNISFVLGNEDGSTKDGRLCVIADGEYIKTCDVYGTNLPIKYTLNVEDVYKLEFVVESGANFNNIGVADIKVFK